MKNQRKVFKTEYPIHLNSQIEKAQHSACIRETILTIKKKQPTMHTSTKRHQP